MSRKIRINSFGDYVEDYKPEELVFLYLDDGHDLDSAQRLAQQLSSGLRSLNNKSKDIWKKSKNF